MRRRRYGGGRRKSFRAGRRGRKSRGNMRVGRQKIGTRM